MGESCKLTDFACPMSFSPDFWLLIRLLSLGIWLTVQLPTDLHREYKRRPKMTSGPMRKLLCLLVLQSTFFVGINGITDLSHDDEDDDTKLLLAAHVAMETPLNMETPPNINRPSVSSKNSYSGVYTDYTDTKLEHYRRLTGKDTSNLDEVCKVKGGWDYFPFPGSCNQYLHCDKAGKAFLETCAVGTFFNGRKCMRAEDVECFWDPCRKLQNGRRYSDGQTCYGYYKCLNGQSVTGICPDGFAFNAIKQGCIPDMTCKQPSGLLHPCFAGTTMPYPGQPHMFYLWDGFESVTSMTCPKGLWYNPHVCTCDWLIPGNIQHGTSCNPMFHFGYNGDFLEEYNQAPQAPNTAVSIYQKSALFSKGGRIVIWMMNDIDMDSQWALCFEFMTEVFSGEVALISNDWKKNPFTYKITYLPLEGLVKGYFRMKDDTVVELIVMGVEPNMPHFIRVAKQNSLMTMRVDNMPAATIKAPAGVASANSPMVVGSSNGCVGFAGYFDELKFFRCVPDHFFGDYEATMKR